MWERLRNLWHGRLRKIEPVNNNDHPITGKYYRRTGSCNQCAKCCQDIYLVYGKQTVANETQFKAIQALHADYAPFYIAGETEHGLLFRCNNLSEEGLCTAYDSRPSFCRKYPLEDNLLQGGTLSSECSYVFTPLVSFQETLKQSCQKIS